MVAVILVLVFAAIIIGALYESVVALFIIGCIGLLAVFLNLTANNQPVKVTSYCVVVAMLVSAIVVSTSAFF
jgi:hypothetical protein